MPSTPLIIAGLVVCACSVALSANAIPQQTVQTRQARETTSIDDQLIGHLRCCDAKDISVVERLLANGANPNAHDDYNASSVLAYAITNDRADIARLLIARGAKANAVSKSPSRQPELFEARSLAMIALLIANGADTAAKDDAGRTVLHFHARGGHPEIVEFFLLHGLDVNARDTSGITPLDLAHVERDILKALEAQKPDGFDERVLHNSAVVRLLAKYGAKEPVAIKRTSGLPPPRTAAPIQDAARLAAEVAQCKATTVEAKESAVGAFYWFSFVGTWAKKTGTVTYQSNSSFSSSDESGGESVGKWEVDGNVLKHTQVQFRGSNGFWRGASDLSETLVCIDRTMFLTNSGGEISINQRVR